MFHLHSPVRMYVRAAPRAMLVRTLVYPGISQAKLPLGPPTLQQHQGALTAKGIGRKVEGQACDIHGEAAKLVNLMENQLISIAGVEGAEAASRLGHRGPKTASQPGGERKEAGKEIGKEVGKEMQKQEGGGKTGGGRRRREEDLGEAGSS